MKTKETIDKAFGSIPNEVTSTDIWDWIPTARGLKFYYLKVIRFFTR